MHHTAITPTHNAASTAAHREGEKERNGVLQGGKMRGFGTRTVIPERLIGCVYVANLYG